MVHSDWWICETSPHWVWNRHSVKLQHGERRITYLSICSMLFLNTSSLFESICHGHPCHLCKFKHFSIFVKAQSQAVISELLKMVWILDTSWDTKLKRHPIRWSSHICSTPWPEGACGAERSGRTWCRCRIKWLWLLTNSWPTSFAYRNNVVEFIKVFFSDGEEKKRTKKHFGCC